MKVQTQTTEVIRSNVQQEQIFTIKATAKSFEILSSGLYSDKILAIVRELSCNAWDSHVAANKQDIPIEVKLPNSIDNTFHVKDFGIGLTHEQVCTLYTTYFDSTKTDSNEFIGALGLGSKSPFSYVSNFIVESRKDGIHRIYSCFKNEHGLPSITLLAESETEEDNGLTVKLVVNPNDCDKFTTAAKKAFMYFDPCPNVVGYYEFKPFYVKHTIQGPTWKMRETDYWSYYRGPRVVQGFVSYPIDTNVLQQQDLSDMVKILLSTNIDLYVDIGDVDIAASREALSYDPRTVKNLISALSQVELDLQQSIQTQFDECKSEWEVGLLIHDLTIGHGTEFGNLFTSVKNITWNGKPISRTVSIDSNLLKNHSVALYYLDYGVLRVKHRVTFFDNKLLAYKNTHILYDPYHRGKDTYKQKLYSYPTLDPFKPMMLVIRPDKKNTILQEEVDAIIGYLDSPEYDTTVPPAKPERSKRSARTREKESKLYWTDFPTNKTHRHSVRRKFSHLCWDSELIDITEGGIYVDTNFSAVIHDGNQFYMFDELIRCATRLDIIKHNTKVYGFTKNEMKEINKLDNWVNLFDLVMLQFKNEEIVNGYMNYIKNDYIPKIDYSSSSFINYYISEWDNIKDNYPNKFGEFIQELYDAKQLAVSNRGEYVSTLVKILKLDDIQTIIGQVEQNLKNKWFDLVRYEYPLMTYIRSLSYDQVVEMAPAVSQYFNLVDNFKKVNDNN